MKIVLLSGGSGKRLWPLSNNLRSKQFLEFLTSPEGNKESMIQRVVRQIKKTGLSKDIIVMTGLNQEKILKSQLGQDLIVVTEPNRRDTFPAIYLACTYLYSQGASIDETVIVLPCDTFASDEYYFSLCRIEECVESNIADLVLIGVTPTHPTSKYGYIIPEEEAPLNSEVMRIKSFIEKPNVNEASKLVKDGALWNSGCYGFRLGYMMDLGFKTFNIADFESLIMKYDEVPKLNFSYEVLEKVDRKNVIPFKGNWRDIGTWNDFALELDFFEFGNVKSYDCHNTYIINELSMPLICVGCDNLIVASSQDGILVANSNKCENIKNLIDSTMLKSSFKECNIEDSKIIDGVSVKIQHLVLRSGCITNYLNKSVSYEILIVTEGNGEIEIDGCIRSIESDFVTIISKGVSCTVHAISSLNIMIVTQSRNN